MNRLDLIIEAIRLAEYHVKAKGWGDDIDLELYTEALAAARELRDAESKKAQWGNPKYLIEEAVLAEREACAKLCEEVGRQTAEAIRARSEPSPAFKNYMGDNWAGIV